MPSNIPLAVSPWFHNQRLMATNPIRYFKELQRDFGDFVRVRGLLQGYFLNDPELIGVMLTSKTIDRSTKIHERMSNVSRTGLTTGDGPRWRKQRRLLAPLFTAAAVRGFGEVMIDVAQDWAERWEAASRNGTVFNIKDEMNELTLKLNAKYLFSTEVSGDQAELKQGFAVLKEYLECIPYPIVGDFSFPRPLHLRTRKAIQLFDRYTTDLIEQRRSASIDQGSKDLVARMLLAKDPETGATMNDDEIRHEMLTFFVAGYETTSSGLLWTFYHLAKHPEVEAQVHAELDAVLGDRPLTMDDYPKLSYTKRFIDEVQRITPSTWFFARSPIEDIDLCGTPVKKGSLLAISTPSLHQNPKVWPNPERFDPDRFLPEVAAKRSPNAYIPFGRGEHICIGKYFALQELVLVTAALARQYRVVMEQPDFELDDVNAGVSMYPRHGIKMRAVRRARSPQSLEFKL